MEWFALDPGFEGSSRHTKLVRALRDELARWKPSPREKAVLLALRLLCWTAQHREYGDLSGIEPEDLAEALRFAGDPERLLAALTEAEWIGPGEHYPSELIGWLEWQGVYLSRRDAARASYRRRKGKAAAEPPAPQPDLPFPSEGESHMRLTSNASESAMRRCEPSQPSDQPSRHPPKPPSAGSARSRRGLRLRQATDAQLDHLAETMRARLADDPSHETARRTLQRIQVERDVRTAETAAASAAHEESDRER